MTIGIMTIEGYEKALQTLVNMYHIAPDSEKQWWLERIAFCKKRIDSIILISN